MLLVHNHDTSIKTFVGLLNDKIKKIPNINNYSELDLCNRDIVSLTVGSLAQDMEKLISMLNKEGGDEKSILPKIVVAQSHSIQPSAFGRNTKKFKMQDIIKLKNKDDDSDVLSLAGQMFTYETPVQIIVLARSGYAAKEIALHTWNILANNYRIKYSLLLRDEANNQFHAVEDYGHINLVGVRSSSFSDASVPESGVVASAMDFTLREQFFMLRDSEEIAKKYKFNVIVENHRIG